MIIKANCGKHLPKSQFFAFFNRKSIKKAFFDLEYNITLQICL